MLGYAINPGTGKLIFLSALVLSSLSLYIQVKLMPQENKNRRRWSYMLYYTLLLLIATIIIFGIEFVKGPLF